MIDKSKDFWYGDDLDDIDEYLRYSTRIIIIFLELSAILHTSARENSNDVILNDTSKLLHRSTKLSRLIVPFAVY